MVTLLPMSFFNHSSSRCTLGYPCLGGPDFGRSGFGDLAVSSNETCFKNKDLAGEIYRSFHLYFLLITWLGIISLGAGLLLFKQGDLAVLNSEQITILRQQDVVWRFLSAFAVAILSLSVVTSLSLLFSCFADNSLGPIVSTMAIIIVFTLIGTMEISLFEKIKPYLFTTHMIVWRDFFIKPLPVAEIRNSILVMTGHISLFLGIALYYFRRKDILS
jgi:ABC-2 type transport system permease protein